MRCVQDYADKVGAQKIITYTWLVTQFFVLLGFIGGCVTASANDGSSDGSSSAAFVAVWTMLLVVGLSVGGTMVMRQYTTPLAVGFFLGVCIMMSMHCFNLTVIFAGLADGAEDDGEADANNTFAAFTFFLFACYAVFSVVLIMFRAELIAHRGGESAAGLASHDAAAEVNQAAMMTQAAPAGGAAAQGATPVSV